MAVHYILQNASNPSIYYREKRGSRSSGSITPAVLVEVTKIDQATKFNSIKQINKTLERVFFNKIKGHMTDLSAGFKIIKSELVVTYLEEKNIEDETATLISDLKSSSKLVKNTHYSVIELFNKIRQDPNLADYKYILSTVYDRFNTSKLQEMFEAQGLEPVKHKGNFAFNREDYWTAAKIVCDVPYKSFNLTE